MQKIFLWIIVILQFFLANSASGQNTIPHNQLQSVIPQSPTAASLGKYGEVPVGTYTGVPNISIPIYEVITGKLTLPVSLSYHAGGVKVEEMASWVGLGWSLNAGGVLTRQVRGLPDESGEGFLTRYVDLRKYVNNQMNPSEKAYYLDQVNSGIWDAQPDLFTYNVGGLSGTFFYDTTGALYTKPLSKVQISGGDTWEIIDNSGNTYAFSAVENTNSESINNGTLSSNPSGNIKTSWYLTRITNATNTDSIVFEYENTSYSFYTLTGQTKYHLISSFTGCASKDINTYTSTNAITGKRLTRIVFTNGEILFKKKSSEREDLPDDYALDTIIVKNNSNTFHKKIIFHQHYEIASNPPQQNYSEYYRLYLDSVSVVDSTISSVMRYKFEYNSPGYLPHRMSYSQDHWGYYNGAQNGNNFIPTTTLPTTLGSSVIINGADRAPSSSNSKYGMLQKIVYPTGGSTVFDYENNYALSPRNTYTIENRGYVSLGTQINGPSYYETDTFTVGACDTALTNITATVYLSTASCGGGQQQLGCPLVNLVGITNPGYSAPIVSNGTISIPPGDYKITADLYDVTDSNLYNSFYVEMYWEKCNPIVVGSTTYYHTMVGGHRIKSVIDYDERGNVADSRYYNYNLPDTAISSGTLLCFPNYVGMFTEGFSYTMPPFTWTWTCNYFTINSASNYPLLTTQGSYVGYSYVKELNGSNGADGITEFTYTSPLAFPDVVNQDFPFPPSNSFEWRRGLLLKERKSKAVISGETISFSPIQETKKTYTEFLADSVQGLKTGTYMYLNYQPNTKYIAATTFLTSSGWVALSSDTLRIYDQKDTLKYTTTTTSYEHSTNNLQPNKTTNTINVGKKQIVRIKYPMDYTIASGSSVSENLGLKYLKDHNIINTPVEKYLIQKDVSGNEYVIGGTITTFKPNRPVPDKLYGLEITTPIAINSFTVSSLDGSGNFVKDSRYKEQVNFNKYDISENISEQYKANNFKQSYIWNYGLAYPIAEVMNADSSSIAYSSFEGENKGNWSYSGSTTADGTSPTGKKCYNLSGNNITISGLTSATYIVSYWSKSGNAYTVNGSAVPARTGKTIGSWTYYEHEISGTSVTVSGSNYIDELRLYPKGAMMTTYSYEPLLGITSQSDVAGHITYYEYDSLGRLKLIKDEDGRILKRLDYKYQGTFQQ